MTDMQQIEIDRYRKEIEDDVRSLVEKYRRAMDWDIPGNDNSRSDRLVLGAIRQALDSVEASLS